MAKPILILPIVDRQSEDPEDSSENLTDLLDENYDSETEVQNQDT